MKRINKAVVNPGAPADGNVFWVDTSNPDKPILKIHDSNGWIAVGGEGGGSTEGAVSYNEQELTDEEKMQARKNQGLYYKEETEGIIEKNTEVLYDFRSGFFDTLGESVSDEVWNSAYTLGGLVKVSDDTPSEDDFISLIYREYDNDGEVSYSEEVSLVGSDTIEINGNNYNSYYGDGYYCLKANYGEAGKVTGIVFLVVTEDSGIDLILDPDTVEQLSGISSIVHLSKGLYVYEAYSIQDDNIYQAITVKYNYDSIVTVYNNPIESGFTGAVSYKEEQSLVMSEQMLARKNQGLYYSDIIPDQLIVEWDGNTDGLIWFDEKEA